jgi:hypothetical protein
MSPGLAGRHSSNFGTVTVSRLPARADHHHPAVAVTPGQGPAQAGVERGQAGVVAPGDGQQVGVGDLAVGNDAAPVHVRGGDEGGVVVEEGVPVELAQPGQQGQRSSFLLDGAPDRVGGDGRGVVRAR